jgi:DNA-binding MarR family transcriptional regulator
MQEEPIMTLQSIADFTGYSLATVKKHSREWQKKGFLIPRLFGRPPNRRKVIVSYPSLLKRIHILL